EYFRQLIAAPSRSHFPILYHYVLPYFQTHQDMQKCFVDNENWKKWILPLMPPEELVEQHNLKEDSLALSPLSPLPTVTKEKVSSPVTGATLNTYDLIMIIVKFVLQWEFTLGHGHDEGKMYSMLMSALQIFEDHTTAWVNRRVLAGWLTNVAKRCAFQ